MILTKEHEMEIDECKYIPYLKITKYDSEVALVIDFKSESVEIHNTKPRTSLVNVMPYDIPIDVMKSGLPLFDREGMMAFVHKDISPSLPLWLQIKFYDLDGHKCVYNLNPKEENNPITSILKWIKKEYGDVPAMQKFFQGL